jgi:hypothetical protein
LNNNGELFLLVSEFQIETILLMILTNKNEKKHAKFAWRERSQISDIFKLRIKIKRCNIISPFSCQSTALQLINVKSTMEIVDGFVLKCHFFGQASLIEKIEKEWRILQILIGSWKHDINNCKKESFFLYKDSRERKGRLSFRII